MENVRLARIAGIVAILALAFAPAGAGAAAAPTATTSPVDPTTLTNDGATLSGVVVPNGANTSYWFQWGHTTAYGHFTTFFPAGNAKAPAQVPVDVPLFGLKPTTTYHYRLGVWTGPGTTPIYGADETFTTTPPVGLAFKGSRVYVTSKGVARIAATAVGPAYDTAAGKLKLTARIGHAVHSLGVAKYAVDTGAKATIRLKLNKAARTALGTGQKLVVKARAKTKGNKRATVAKLTLAR